MASLRAELATASESTQRLAVVEGTLAEAQAAAVRGAAVGCVALCDAGSCK